MTSSMIKLFGTARLIFINDHWSILKDRCRAVANLPSHNMRHMRLYFYIQDHYCREYLFTGLRAETEFQS